MMITDKNIDGGRPFDWGLVSEKYAKYRDIYPEEFYKRIVKRNLCISGQRVLDLGTGTGVLPRNMYKYGAVWTGADISKNQIEQAKLLSSAAGMNIDYIVSAAEDIDFAENSFDVITACQCFGYFDYKRLADVTSKILRPDGRFLVLYMAWLPYEDKIAGESEKLVLKYNPDWSGAGETLEPISVPDEMKEYFDLEYHEEYKLKVPFTRESWHGRMTACRGVGASLSDDELEKWSEEHRKMLGETAPEKFEVQHYAAMAELRVRK
ncbi:MAG: class I SAM-dependent methyltransferase [Acutalibacteraceae bacterium]